MIRSMDASARRSEVVGPAVSARRKALRFSVSKAASIANISRQTWTSIEEGTRETEDYTYAAVERALGWDAGVIQGMLDGKPPPDTDADTGTSGREDPDRARNAPPRDDDDGISTWTRYLERALSQPGWSTARLARESGVHHSTIERWLRGHTNDVNVASIKAIARALGADPERAIIAAQDELNASSPIPGVESVDVWEAGLVLQFRSDPALTETEKRDFVSRIRRTAADRRVLEEEWVESSGRRTA